MQPLTNEELNRLNYLHGRSVLTQEECDQYNALHLRFATLRRATEEKEMQAQKRKFLLWSPILVPAMIVASAAIGLFAGLLTFIVEFLRAVSDVTGALSRWIEGRLRR